MLRIGGASVRRIALLTIGKWRRAPRVYRFLANVHSITYGTSTRRTAQFCACRLSFSSCHASSIASKHEYDTDFRLYGQRLVYVQGSRRNHDHSGAYTGTYVPGTSRIRVLMLFERSEFLIATSKNCLLYTSPSPRDKRQSRMPSSA